MESTDAAHSLALLWSSEGRGLVGGGTPFEEGYFLGRGWLPQRRVSSEEGLLMGKASKGESSPQRRSPCRGRGGVFPPGPGSPQRRSPQGRHLLRGGVSPREGSFQGRVSAEEEFPEGRVSLADARGGRRGGSHARQLPQDSKSQCSAASFPEAPRGPWGL